MKRATFLLLPLLALAGCGASPEQRVNAALQEAGLPAKIARCMAGRMTERLSIEQLKELKSVAKAETPGEKMSVKRVLRRIAELGDPQIVTVTTNAAIKCEIGG